MLWKVQKVAKKVQKNAHHWILFPNEKIFNIEEKFNHQNGHMYAKSWMRSKTKYQIFRGSSPLDGDGLVGNFVLWCNLDSFLKHQCKNKWWGLPIVLNDVLPPLKETVFADKDELCSQQDSAPAYKAKNCKNGCKSTSQISSKWMTGPSLAQTPIHWTINCGQCWRNVSMPGGTQISTQWRLLLWRRWRNSPGHNLGINRWLAQMFAALCASKRRPFWVMTIEMSFLKYFLSFLKIL